MKKVKIFCLSPISSVHASSFPSISFQNPQLKFYFYHEASLSLIYRAFSSQFLSHSQFLLLIIPYWTLEGKGKKKPTAKQTNKKLLTLIEHRPVPWFLQCSSSGKTLFNDHLSSSTKHLQGSLLTHITTQSYEVCLILPTFQMRKLRVIKGVIKDLSL
jgi:hypothetical protein